MWKPIYFLPVIFLTTYSLASPRVGDTVTYGLTHVQNEKVDGTFTLVNEIMAIDELNHIVSVRQTVFQDGKVMSRETHATPSAQVAYPTEAIIATCGKVSYPGQTGTPEVLTVPAGKFKTCHIVLDETQNGQAGEYYAAAVPFGFVKSISTNSTGTMTSLLISFSKN